MRKVILQRCLIVFFALALACIPVLTAVFRKVPKLETEYEVKQLDKNVKTTIKVLAPNGNEDRAFIENLAKEFKKYYPNVTIKYDPLSGDLNSMLTGFYNSEKSNPGTMPDIFLTDAFSMNKFADEGIVLNLDSLITVAENEEVGENTFELNKAFGAFDASEYYETYWKLGQKDYNGSQILVPRSLDTVVTHYNKAMVNEANTWLINNGKPGISSKIKNGWTWQDFLDVCQGIREYWDSNEMGKQSLYLVDAYLDWEANWNAIFESFGVKYYDAENDIDCALDSQETRDALTLIKDVVEKRYVAPFNKTQANFEGGQGVMLFHSKSAQQTIDNLYEIYKNEIGAGKKYSSMNEIYDVVTFPLIGDNPKIGSGVAGYCIFSGCAGNGRGKFNKEVSWEFLRLMLTKDGQNIMADSGLTYTPIRKDMADTTNQENKWAYSLRQQGFNMSAYVYYLEKPECFTATTFTAYEKYPSKASASLVSAVQNMVAEYVNGKSFSKVFGDVEADFDYYINL